MSQNQSYFWHTTRHNVYLKRRAKFHLLMALMTVLTFSTICLAEIDTNFNDDGLQVHEPTKFALEQNAIAKGELIEPAANEIPTVEPENKDAKSKTGFIDAFTASISVILFTELGDKTFFIAAIMAMRHPRLIVFTGAIGALALMTILSVVFGMAATIIPKVYTYYISTALFAIFGFKMIYDGYMMKDSDAQEELEEVQSDLRKREDELLRAARGKKEDPEAKRKNSNSDKEEGLDDDEGSAGAATTTSTIALPPNTSSNAEVKHRQRKQLNNNNLNNNISANINNNKGCELNNLDDANGGEGKETDVFLESGTGVSLKMATFHSSPALSMSASSQITNCDELSDNRNSLKDRHEFNSTPRRQQRIDMEKMNGDIGSATPLVHSASVAAIGNNNNNNNNNATSINSTSINMQHAVMMNKGNGSLAGGAGAPTTNSIINGLSSHSLNSIAGQSNGELKQVGGSKKRLERDVTATLIQDPESGVVRKNTKKTAAYLTTRVLMQAFTMTFVAEWGDRSQLTTIILAASKNVYGVIVGGILGHSICTGLAVIGGRIVAAKISVRTVTIVGGIVFVGFAVYALIFTPDDL